MFYGVVGGLRRSRRQRMRQIWLIWLGGLTHNCHINPYSQPECVEENNNSTTNKSIKEKIKKRSGSSENCPVQQQQPPCKMEDCSPKTPESSHGSSSTSLMERLLGLLRIRVKRGVNLAVRDVRSSDPYVVVKMGRQKLKTRVIKKDVNPEWNEDLTLSVTDPSLPIKLTVYDHDTFSKDDKMGGADFDIRPYIEALRMNLSDLPSGTVITKVHPDRHNCLSEESSVMWSEGRVVQDIILRLRNVECGELEIQLQWIDLPGSKGL